MKNIMKLNWIITILLTALIAVSCAPSTLPAPTQAPTGTPTPSATSTPAPLISMKVVTFNVLFGAGIDREWDTELPNNMQGIDRSPLLINYLKQLAPDIVGLQEATGWDKGSPPYIKILADQLGMNYFTSTGRADSALLTKYEILEAEDLSDEFNSVVRARLLGPDGESVNVFVIHLDSDSEGHRSCGVQFLLQKMQPYLEQRTILLGDTNFLNASGEWGVKALEAQSWQMVAMDSHFKIDQIWVAPSMQWDVTEWTAPISQEARQISDHWPLGKEIRIYSPSRDLLPVATPTTLPQVIDLPAPITEKISNPQITFVEQPESACKLQSWDAGWINESYIKGQLRLFGKKDWQSGSSWSTSTPDGGGVFLDFKYNAGAEFNIFLEHSTWAQPDYRRFGLYLANDKLRSDMWKAETPLGGDAWSGAVQPKPDTWYRLFLAVDKNTRLVGFLWEVDNPSNISSFQREMDGDWSDLNWRLATGANQGRAYVQNVTQIIFDVIK